MHLLYVTQKIQKNVRTTIKREVDFPQRASSENMFRLDKSIFGL